MQNDRISVAVVFASVLTAHSFPVYGHEIFVPTGAGHTSGLIGGTHLAGSHHGLSSKGGSFPTIGQNVMAAIHAANPTVFTTGHPERYQSQNQTTNNTGSGQSLGNSQTSGSGQSSNSQSAIQVVSQPEINQGINQATSLAVKLLIRPINLAVSPVPVADKAGRQPLAAAAKRANKSILI